MTALTFTVLGKSEPQGSARAFTYHRKAEKGGGIGARVDTDNPRLKQWRRAVAVEARRAMGSTRPYAKVPVRVCAAFYLPRPKYLKGRSIAHVTKPDIDKTGRAILDAMTGVVYADDAQVTQLKVIKAYAAVGDPPHAVISVMPLPAVEGGLFR